MIGGLVPGFRPAGQPVKADRRARDDEYAEAVRRHEARDPVVRARDEMVTADEVVRDPAEWEPDRNDLSGVDTGPDWGPRSRPYTPEEEAEMESMRSARYRGDDPGYHHRPKGARSAWDAVERLGTIAPVMGNPSLDPAGGDLIVVSYMCGYGRDTPIGHDAMDGVDLLVTGDVDATRELEVESATGPPESGPLRVEHNESVYSDDHMLGTHDLRIDAGQAGDDCDWCAELRLWEHEPEARGWL